MSSYHILTASGKGISYRLNVEYHTPVPVETLPLTGFALRDLLANDPDIDKTSAIADSGELTQLANGEILKVLQSIKIHEAKSNVEIRDTIRSRYDELAVKALDRLREKYRGYGFNETKGVEF